MRSWTIRASPSNIFSRKLIELINERIWFSQDSVFLFPFSGKLFVIYKKCMFKRKTSIISETTREMVNFGIHNLKEKKNDEKGMKNDVDRFLIYIFAMSMVSHQK